MNFQQFVVGAFFTKRIFKAESWICVAKGYVFSVLIENKGQFRHQSLFALVMGVENIGLDLTPNKIGENVISYLNTFPKEFGLDKQVDYDLQFEKSFLEPIKVIMDTIGWQPEKVASLEFLFG